MELKFYTKDYEVVKIFDAWSIELFIAKRSEKRTNNRNDIIYAVSPDTFKDLSSNLGNQFDELNKLYTKSRGKTDKCRRNYLKLKEHLTKILEEDEDMRAKDEFVALRAIKDKYDVLLDLANKGLLMVKVVLKV